ncbi:unnamed protein product [Withania somnifera]
MAQIKLPHFLSLLLLLLFVLSPSSSLKIREPSKFASEQAEKLIHELNLFPKESVNIVDRDPYPTDEASRIVEKRFAFPNLVNSSVSFEDLGHHAGYYKIKHSLAARLFYFFFESRGSKVDPVVIWLSGGPGCSSELALFYENGPFTVSKNLSLVPNEYGWDKVSNLIYVDQPTGTGFSYSSDRRDLCHGEACVSDDLYDFIQAFFEEHPELVKNDFYITRESYAGHYIPAFAARVHKGNKGKEGTHINLKHYDIRKKCVGRLCHDFSDMEKMLNMLSVKQALGVEDIEFVSCSSTVAQGMLADWMKNFEVGIPTLLEDGIKLLVYAREYDLICNWLGNSRWVQAMEWSGQKEFVASPKVPFEVNGSEAGLFRSHGPLSFLKVHDAGHMVPMDQPKAALEMLKRWTRGTLSQATTETKNLDASM